MAKRLPQSKRNALIEDYRNGIEDPNYEVIPSKTTKGKFTIRKKKQIEPKKETEEEDENEDENEEPEKEETQDDSPEVDDQTNSMFNPMAYFQEYQLQVNKLLIEQMKALRQNSKYMMKKQQKYKTRQKQIRDIFAGIANKEDEHEEEPEPLPIKETEPEEQETQEEQPKNYFDNNYPAPESKPVQMEKVPEPEPQQIEYKNDYEAELDNMAGAHQYSSRRNRLKAFI